MRGRYKAMTNTEDKVTERKGNKIVSFTVGANDFTVVSGADRQFIVAKGAMTHVIEDPELIARLLAKYSSAN